MKIHAFHLLNDRSGSPKVLRALCQAWVRQGHEVHLAYGGGQNGFLSQIQGVANHTYWYRFFANRWLRLVAYALSQAMLLLHLRRVKRGDVVYVNTLLPFAGALIGWWRGAQVVYHIHETSQRPRVLRWFLLKVVEHTACRVVVVSQYVADQLPPLLAHVDVLPNALDAEFAAKAFAQPHAPASHHHVLMVCSLKTYKGVDQFRKLALARPEYRFRLVVNASVEAVGRYFAAEGIPQNLEILPAQSHIHPHYAWARIVLNLSLPDQWVETFGLTALEAMAYGRPVIVPPVGGIAEVVQDGQQGFQVDSRDFEVLLEKVDRLLQDAEIYERMALSARRRARLYNEVRFEESVEGTMASLRFHLEEENSRIWKGEAGAFGENGSDSMNCVGGMEMGWSSAKEDIAMKTKVAIIGTVGLPAKYGGFETLAAQLVTHLGGTHDLTVYCAGPEYPKHTRKQHHGAARLHYLPLRANGWQSVLYDSWSILHAVRHAEVLLVLGVAGAWLFPFLRLFTRKRIVVSIDGIEWKRAKWGMAARWFLYWSEKVAVRFSHVDISDNEAIQDYTAMRYGTLSRLLAYGADHAQRQQATAADRQKYPFLHLPYTIKVCRIEPENNVEMVLEAFRQLPRHRLVIVGNWKHSDYARQLRARYAGHPNIRLLDPIYDQRLLDVLRSHATAYVHGHSAGGTNPSLIEAMYLGLPVIAYGVSYNRSTTEGKARYFDSVESLRRQLESIPMAELVALGQEMGAIAARRYTWRAVAAGYQRVIAEALEGRPKARVRPRLATQLASLPTISAAHLQHSLPFFEHSNVGER